MKRKRGEHLERDETKIAIIAFMLGTNKKSDEPGILESKIREHLKSKYGLIDQGNIRDLLKDLIEDEDKACLEKFPFKKKGQPNYWDIQKFKHLKNIIDKYSYIQWNKYEKSLNIILKKTGHDVNTPQGLKFYILLLLSASFFKKFIETDLETLYSRIWEIYLYNRSLKHNQKIEENLNQCYATYLERNPESQMSIETFGKIIEETFFKICDEIFPGWKKEIPKETYLKILREMFQKTNEILENTLKACEENFPKWVKEMPRDKYLQFSETLKKTKYGLLGKTFAFDMIWKRCEEEFPEWFRKLPEEIYIKSLRKIIAGEDVTLEEVLDIYTEKFQGTSDDKLSEIRLFIKTLQDDITIYTTIEAAVTSMKIRFFEFFMLRDDLLFDHCFYQDLLTGVASDDEIAFAKKTKENFEKYISRPESEYNLASFEKMLLFDLEQASIVMYNYKQPSIFDKKIYDNKDDILKALKEYFNRQIQPIAGID